MTMPSNRDLERLLRAALQAEVGSLEPAPGGLERINSRLRRPLPLPAAWLAQAWSYLAMRVPQEAEALAGLLKVAWRHTLSGYRTVERFVPGPANRHGRPSRLGFLRPVTVMVFAIAVLAAGVYAGFDVSQGFSPSSGNGGVSSTGVGGHPHNGSQPATEGNGTQSNGVVGNSSSTSGGSPTPTSSACTKKKSGTKSKSSTCKSSSSSAPAPSSQPAVGGSLSGSPSTTTTPPSSSSPASPTPTSSSPSPTPSVSSSSTPDGSSTSTTGS